MITMSPVHQGQPTTDASALLLQTMLAQLSFTAEVPAEEDQESHNSYNPADFFAGGGLLCLSFDTEDCFYDAMEHNIIAELEEEHNDTISSTTMIRGGAQEFFHAVPNMALRSHGTSSTEGT